ncbi:hypothetical protein KIH32_01425 [Pseudomonas fluorescens]|uniref:DUF6957 family protein n=1 Tax=Pseudomonas fluorescens TaxID=294 RepID=UPI001BDAAC09|nr:hypothetical protein [Pseudomonas fluorescens]MBT0622549.1 hypothetical protein [Pseudomonas fluorescens]
MNERTVDGGIWSDALTSVPGKSPSREAVVRLIAERFPYKAYCLVEDWIVFESALTQDELEKVQSAGHIPFFIFAYKVVHDSSGRFQAGDWVRSSMCISSHDGYMFETKSTVYVLMGDGHEMLASLKTIFSFF